MRTLAIILSVIVLGCLTIITLFVDTYLTDEYDQQVAVRFLAYAQIVSPLIEQSLLAGSEQQAIEQWLPVISQQGGSIKLIDYPNTDRQHVVKSVVVTDQTDIVEVIAPLQAAKYQQQALLITFHDGFNDQQMALFNRSVAIVFAMMAIVLTIIVWPVYAYIRRIGKVTDAVAAGRFDLTMPDNPIPALKKLAADINAMSVTIQDKTTDNLILTGAIHHELRIPITRMRLALDMALGSDQDEILQELLTGIDDDLEALSNLMEELLTISRLRLKGMALEQEPIDVAKLVAKVCDDTTAECSLLPPFKLTANYTLLERAIVNVVNNALKYANSKVEVKAKLENQRWVLSICDDGIGISEDERELVFKPFYRTDKSRNRTTGGFGLGLAIAEMVIKDTQGKIEIGQSDLGGAGFYLSWPL